MMMDNNIGLGGEMKRKKRRNAWINVVIIVHWCAWRQRANALTH